MRSTRRLSLVVLCAVLVLGAVALSGCGQRDVAVKVNGDAITLTELNAQLEQIKKQYPNMFTGADGEGRLLDYKVRLVENLISQKLVEQAAKEKGIKVTDAEVNKQIDQLKSGFKDEAQFTEALKGAGMTLDTLKVQIKNQLMTQKLIESLASDTKVDDAAVAAYYEKNKDQFFQAAAKRSSHILFKPEDKATAEKVLKEVQSGGDFAALAKKYSIDTATASKGGDLGWPSTPYVTEFQTALDKLKKGQTSALVQSPYGWHIIRVTDERAGSQQKIEDVKDQIKQIIIQQERADAYQDFLNKLRKKAKIEYVDEELKTAAGKASQSSSTATKTP